MPLLDKWQIGIEKLIFKKKKWISFYRNDFTDGVDYGAYLKTEQGRQSNDPQVARQQFERTQGMLDQVRQYKEALRQTDFKIDPSIEIRHRQNEERRRQQEQIEHDRRHFYENQYGVVGKAIDILHPKKAK